MQADWRRIFHRPNVRRVIKIVLCLAVGVGAFMLGSHIAESHNAPLALLGEVLKELGRLFGIIVVLGLVYEEIQRRQLLEEFTKAIGAQISAVVRATTFEDLPSVQRIGLTAVRAKMDFENLFKELDAGDELLWLDTFNPKVGAWGPDLKEAVQRGATVQMMIIDPDSALVDMRGNEVEVDYEDSSYKEELNHFIEHLRHVKKGLKTHGDGLKLMIYNNLLGCPIYIVRRDGAPIKGYSSLYLNAGTGRDFPHFEWELNGDNCMLKSLEAYFLRKIEKATEDGAVSGEPSP
jgi:hypothetical protein